MQCENNDKSSISWTRFDMNLIWKRADFMDVPKGGQFGMNIRAFGVQVSRQGSSGILIHLPTNGIRFLGTVPPVSESKAWLQCPYGR
jgi:hypothetical protein